MLQALSILIWTTYTLVVIAGFPVVAVLFLLTAPFDPGRYAAGRAFRLLATMAVRLNPLWRFRTSGVRIADPRRPYLAVGNHESFADIFLVSTLPWEMKWLSKESIFRIPFMGWMMRMAGDIPVRRHERASRAAAAEGIQDRLRKRVTVMVMPEGTRGTGEELLPFRHGPFRIAIDTGVPILPIVVAGTREALPRDSLVFQRARAEARVLEPIETTGLTAADAPALRDEVQRRIAEARAELRRELGLA